MTNDLDWDHEMDMYLSPCCNRHECNKYILRMKGRLTYFKGVDHDQFISTASLDVWEMIDLLSNLQDVIDIELERDRLNHSYDKGEI